MLWIFDVKHKILVELYRVSLINQNNQATLFDLSLDLNTLENRVKTTESEFFSSLESLKNQKEIAINWNKKIAVITSDGIVSLNSKKYYDIHKRRVRDTVLFWLKIIGYTSVFITIIRSIIEVTKYFMQG